MLAVIQHDPTILIPLSMLAVFLMSLARMLFKMARGESME
jgi:hypothetical protein